MVTTNHLYTKLGTTTLSQTDVFGKPLTSSTSSYEAVRVATTRTSNSTPLFRTKKRPVPLPMNSFQFTKTTSTTGQGYLFRQLSSSNKASMMFSSYSSEIPTPVGIPASELAALDRQLIQQLLLKMKNQKTNLWQVYAEREKTAQMVGDSAMKIYNAIRNLRKGNFAGAVDAFGSKSRVSGKWFDREYRKNKQKAVASAWLEFQYGWRPLINDVYGATEALAEAYHKYPPEKVVQSLSRSGANTVIVNNLQYGRVTTQHNWDAALRYVCYFRVDNRLTSTLAQMGITNPTLIAWELMPYSFVVDWFLPIGNYISTWDATVGLIFDRGCRTQFEKRFAHRDELFGPNDPTGYRRSGSAQSTRQIITCTRTLLPGFPSPKFPALKNGASVLHMLNAIGLMGIHKQL